MNVEAMTPTERTRYEAALAMAVPPSRPPSATATAAEALSELQRTARDAETALHEAREVLSGPIRDAWACSRNGEGDEKAILRAAREAADAVRDLIRDLPDLAAAAEVCRRVVKGL